MIRKIIVLSILFSVAPVIASSRAGPRSSQGERELSQIYETMKQEIKKETDLSVSEAERSKARARLKNLREQLVSDRTGVIFAINKLQETNRSEASDFSNDCNSDFPSIALTNAPYKYQLIEALAEAYSQLSSDLQNKILQAFENAYTPVVACDLHGGRTVIDWGLVYIGKDAIGVLGRLAKSPAKSVRCGAVDLLNEIAKNATMPVAPAPTLTCEGAQNISEQLGHWYRWWQQNSSKIKVPLLPEADPPL